MLDKIKQLDTELFLYLNSKHNSFFDPIMYWVSDRPFWIPVYAVLVFIVIKEYRKQSVSILISIAILVASCDLVATNLIKNTVKRLRPSYEPLLQNSIHFNNIVPDGEYGFVSLLAANAFGLATFLIIMLPKKYNPLKWGIGLWATLVAYSRIYNGVLYPTDVIVAALLGIILAYLIFLGYVNYIKMYISKNVLVD